MGVFHQLNHLVPKLHEVLTTLKDHPKCGGSIDKVAQCLAKELSELVDQESLKDKFVEGYNPIEKGEQIFTRHAATAMKLVLVGPKDKPFGEFI